MALSATPSLAVQPVTASARGRSDPPAAGGPRGSVAVEPASANSSGRASTAQQLDIDAGHVEFEGPFNHLHLSKGVTLTVHRYRVTAAQLTLERTSRGLKVAGDGAVAFCPCPSPPLTVGFTDATVAPPTDLILRNATFKAYGVPVFWLPLFWLRSPNRFGVVSPKFSYRGRDGLFIGSGLHIPLSKRAEPSPEYLDVLFGNYLLSGVDVGAQLVTVNTLTNVRWDHLRHNVYEIDARGNRELGAISSIAWRIDSLRGIRARTGYGAFEATTRAYEHNRLELGFGSGSTVISVGLQNTAPRGLALREFGLFGPTSQIAIGTAVGSIGTAESSTAVFGLGSNSAEFQGRVTHRSSLRLDARPGPFAVEGTVQEVWSLGKGERVTSSTALMGAHARLGLPLTRRFRGETDEILHWLEPEVVATTALSRGPRWIAADGPASPGRTDAFGTEAGYRSERITTFQLGLSNKLGRPRSSSATTLSLRAGLAQGDPGLRQVGTAKWLSSVDWLAVGGTLGIERSRGPEATTWVSSLRARLGRPDRVALGTRVEGRSGAEPLAARWLLDEGFSPWLTRWFSIPGWTLTTQLDAALNEHVAGTYGMTADLETEQPLSHRAGLAYRHPCGCLAASSMAGWRVGRSGWDVSLLVDLMP